MKTIVPKLSLLMSTNIDLANAQQVLVEFPKDEVLSGHFGAALVRLLNLTDTREAVIGCRDKLHFAFTGWTDDKRALPEIPEVVTFFRALHDAWPFFWHFCEKDGQMCGLVLRMLCDTHVSRGTARSPKRFAFLDALQREHREKQITHASHVLCITHGLKPKTKHEISEEMNQSMVRACNGR